MNLSSYKTKKYPLVAALQGPAGLYSSEVIVMANFGFVYVLRNQSMEGVFKIGFTDRSPLQRVQELNSSTSIPTPFNIVCYGEVDEAREFEALMHSNNSSKRISSNREFFRFSFDELEEVCSSIEEYCYNFIKCEGYFTEESKSWNERSYEKIDSDWWEKVLPFLNQCHDRLWSFEEGKEEI